MNNPKVYFDRENFTIQIRTAQGQLLDKIDLEQCNDAPNLLDYIVFCANDERINDRAFREIFTCLDEVCNEFFGDSIQGVFCPFGNYKTVAWEEKKYA